MYHNTFDMEKVTDELIEWFKDWFENNGKGCNAVIGVSGGKDSTIASALCVKALGKDRVIGVLMPNGTQADIEDSVRVCKHLDIKNVTLNIASAIKAEFTELKKMEMEFGVSISEQTKVNLPPRIRMATLYAVSQSMNGRVINTCNLSEDYVGYSTRYGDAAGDISILGGLTVDEVKQIGRYLDLPVDLVDKVPADGLCEKTDEDNLGFSYNILDQYIRTGECDDDEIKKLIDRKHVINEFKLKPLSFFKPKF